MKPQMRRPIALKSAECAADAKGTRTYKTTEVSLKHSGAAQDAGDTIVINAILVVQVTLAMLSVR